MWSRYKNCNMLAPNIAFGWVVWQKMFTLDSWGTKYLWKKLETKYTLPAVVGRKIYLSRHETISSVWSVQYQVGKQLMVILMFCNCSTELQTGRRTLTLWIWQSLHIRPSRVAWPIRICRGMDHCRGCQKYQDLDHWPPQLICECSEGGISATKCYRSMT